MSKGATAGEPLPPARRGPSCRRPPHCVRGLRSPRQRLRREPRGNPPGARPSQRHHEPPAWGACSVSVSRWGHVGRGKRQWAPQKVDCSIGACPRRYGPTVTSEGSSEPWPQLVTLTWSCFAIVSKVWYNYARCLAIRKTEDGNVAGESCFDPNCSYCPGPNSPHFEVLVLDSLFRTQ